MTEQVTLGLPISDTDTANGSFCCDGYALTHNAPRSGTVIRQPTHSEWCVVGQMPTQVYPHIVTMESMRTASTMPPQLIWRDQISYRVDSRLVLSPGTHTTRSPQAQHEVMSVPPELLEEVFSIQRNSWRIRGRNSTTWLRNRANEVLNTRRTQHILFMNGSSTGVSPEQYHATSGTIHQILVTGMTCEFSDDPEQWWNEALRTPDFEYFADGRIVFVVNRHGGLTCCNPWMQRPYNHRETQHEQEDE